MNQGGESPHRGQTGIVTIYSGGNMQMGVGEVKESDEYPPCAQVPAKAVKTRRGRVWRRTSGSGWDSHTRTVGAGGTGRSSRPRSGGAGGLRSWGVCCGQVSTDHLRSPSLRGVRRGERVFNTKGRWEL